ncbi:MAG TPA: phytanoyl-CoA dioxygenase family protein [Caulobacteraceae bacterium]|nr:phytanoyl-CoA dioxygenase family protein [Caulobacteraceae bacterium]
MQSRHTPTHLDTWRRDGVVLIPNFFTAGEVAAVTADFREVFDRTGADDPLVKRKEGGLGRFNPAQFTGVRSVPLDCSPALNLLGVHPALVGFAREALATDDVHLYQCQAWAKFTGDADYDQPFHCDFVNHTLTGPSDDEHLNSVTFICIFSDVTEAHGPTHYVTRPDSLKIAGPEATLSGDPTLQEQLKPYERSAAGPAGSLFVYGIDIWHRGTNLVAPGGHRYVMTVCFKNARNSAIDFHAWQFHHTQPWKRIFDHATPDQLTCFGVQRPGDAFWTETTLRRAQVRYPNWDMTPYREAMRAPSKARAELEV